MTPDPFDWDPPLGYAKAHTTILEKEVAKIELGKHDLPKEIPSWGEIWGAYRNSILAPDADREIMAYVTFSRDRFWGAILAWRIAHARESIKSDILHDIYETMRQISDGAMLDFYVAAKALVMPIYNPTVTHTNQIMQLLWIENYYASWGTDSDSSGLSKYLQTEIARCCLLAVYSTCTAEAVLDTDIAMLAKLTIVHLRLAMFLAQNGERDLLRAAYQDVANAKDPVVKADELEALVSASWQAKGVTYPPPGWVPTAA